jgi:mRNA-degrading endonuclease RelE of RelBE toxin-antitoxin system
MFEFDLSDGFRKVLSKLSKKDPQIARAINRKIKEIISRDKDSITVYKNLSHGMKNLKRVHITEWLIMTFEVNLSKNFILFVKLASRDDVYKRK